MRSSRSRGGRFARELTLQGYGDDTEEDPKKWGERDDGGE
jgi:hypothetical protein